MAGQETQPGEKMARRKETTEKAVEDNDSSKQ